jgi:4-alpha-glucanotransferase
MNTQFTLRPHGTKPYHTGVAVPIFSLRSERDFGVGQFSDLKILADFMHKSGMDVIQLLPINDTTIFMDWKDSSPYRAVSVFALHPIFLDFSDFLVDFSAAQQKSYLVEQAELSALAQIDYEKTLALKWKYAEILYQKTGESVLASSEFKTFAAARKNWLPAYAAFCALRDEFGTADADGWGKYRNFSEKLLTDLSADKKFADKINLQLFVQFLLHQQLKTAVEYCHTLGIAVKGDISVGVDRKSADAWANPDLFNLDMQAGAPPDVFSETGQNWEFPTYNWGKMAEDGYGWWTDRMKVMAEYFDAYRLDHILGFFRIWEIPATAVRGLLGHFAPALAMSDWEIEENYGIPFRHWGIERFVEPFIKDWVIDEIFGRDNRDEIILQFLDYIGNGNYRLKELVDTERKVERLSDLPDWQVDGLFRLHENVCFVRDHNNPYMYHPRIKMMETSSFREFGAEFKEKLEHLYNDYFYGRNYDFWEEQAYQKLPAIKDATEMLACGEDLGMVPSNVPNVMWNLQILRLIIERMPADDYFISDLVYTPYLSVVTTSSHDTTPLRLWWEEDREFTQRYYNEVMGWNGTAPQFAKPEIVQEIVRRNLNTDAMLAILPIQDWIDMTGDLRVENPADERINNPAHTYHYWRYRMHLDLNELAENHGLTDFYREFIQGTKRGQEG